MKIYSDYLSTIKSAMSSGSRSFVQPDGFVNSNFSSQETYDIKAFLNEAKENKLLPSLQDLANQIGVQPDYNQALGAHPDFHQLKHNGDLEKHSIVSMFIDIKGSTNLFKRYEPETVMVITNTIQRAAIHTCLIFGGYIHRLHGDGLFVYFGGKNSATKTAVKQSLLAASVFNYFVKTDIKNLFDEQGVETISTRTGIDYGDADSVVWAMMGMGEISEVTTCSLHTSLASKMQAYAKSNGIVVGDNVKNLLDVPFYSVVSKRTQKEEDRYIFKIPNENFYYTQFDFDWFNYLKQQDFIVTDLNGLLTVKQPSGTSRNVEDLRPIASRNKPYFTS